MAPILLRRNAMNLNKDIIAVELSTGASIPLRPILAKTGNVYHAVLKQKADETYYNPGKYGVKVDKSVVGGSLPKSAKLAGTTVSAVPGVTQSGNRKVTFNASVTIEGESRNLRLSISALPNGDFNVSGVLNRPGGGAGSKAATSL
jgi:hypothetical protein